MSGTPGRVFSLLDLLNTKKNRSLLWGMRNPSTFRLDFQEPTVGETLYGQGRHFKRIEKQEISSKSLLVQPTQIDQTRPFMTLLSLHIKRTPERGVSVESRSNKSERFWKRKPGLNPLLVQTLVGSLERWAPTIKNLQEEHRRVTLLEILRRGSQEHVVFEENLSFYVSKKRDDVIREETVFLNSSSSLSGSFHFSPRNEEAEEAKKQESEENSKQTTTTKPEIQKNDNEAKRSYRDDDVEGTNKAKREEASRRDI